MKSGIHPQYSPVVFRDVSNGEMFLTRSTIQDVKDTVEWEDGNTYPVVNVDVSASSHPAYTGKMNIIDTAGRVEKFYRRFGRKLINIE